MPHSRIRYIYWFPCYFESFCILESFGPLDCCWSLQWRHCGVPTWRMNDPLPGVSKTRLSFKFTLYKMTSFSSISVLIIYFYCLSPFLFHCHFLLAFLTFSFLFISSSYLFFVYSSTCSLLIHSLPVLYTSLLRLFAIFFPVSVKVKMLMRPVELSLYLTN